MNIDIKLICLLSPSIMYNVLKRPNILHVRHTLNKLNGVIFNIQRFSTHDGPGIRTVIFFKGCNLKCKWCHNPESIGLKSELNLYSEKCIGCGSCFSVCPCHQSIDNLHTINRDKCTSCLNCTKQCYSEALVGVGKTVTAEYVIKSILQDELYYRNSGGGVTFSGGEAMLQADFLSVVLKGCKEHGIHTAIDTAGVVSYSSFKKVLPYTDMFFYDIKAASAEVHKKLTGVTNTKIINNLIKLSKTDSEIVIRIPYIPTMNDKEMSLIADIIKEIPCRAVELLAYHKLGDAKYSALSAGNDMLEITPPSEEELKDALKIFTDKDINAKVK